MEHYIALRNYAMMQFAGIWLKIEDIMWKEVTTKINTEYYFMYFLNTCMKNCNGLNISCIELSWPRVDWDEKKLSGRRETK